MQHAAFLQLPRVSKIPLPHVPNIPRLYYS
jgi:hypothetical protein